MGFLVTKSYQRKRSESGGPIQTVVYGSQLDVLLLDISILNAARPVYSMSMNCQRETQGVRQSKTSQIVLFLL